MIGGFIISVFVSWVFWLSSEVFSSVSSESEAGTGAPPPKPGLTRLNWFCDD